MKEYDHEKCKHMDFPLYYCFKFASGIDHMGTNIFFQSS